MIDWVIAQHSSRRDALLEKRARKTAGITGSIRQNRCIRDVKMARRKGYMERNEVFTRANIPKKIKIF